MHFVRVMGERCNGVTSCKTRCVAGILRISGIVMRYSVVEYIIGRVGDGRKPGSEKRV